MNSIGFIPPYFSQVLQRSPVSVKTGRTHFKCSSRHINSIAVGSHFLLQGNLPDPGIESASVLSPALAGGFFIASATWGSM